MYNDSAVETSCYVILVLCCQLCKNILYRNHKWRFKSRSMFRRSLQFSFLWVFVETILWAKNRFGFKANVSCGYWNYFYNTSSCGDTMLWTDLEKKWGKIMLCNLGNFVWLCFLIFGAGSFCTFRAEILHFLGK